VAVEDIDFVSMLRFQTAQAFLVCDARGTIGIALALEDAQCDRRWRRRRLDLTVNSYRRRSSTWQTSRARWNKRPRPFTSFAPRGHRVPS
jgi:hypothetical protein